MVVLRDEIERSLRVGHGVSYIAQCLGLSGTVHGDGTAEIAKLVLAVFVAKRFCGGRRIVRPDR